MTEIPLKRCSRKDKCIHPNGSYLPATIEFFGLKKGHEGKFRSRCRACERHLSNESHKTPERKAYLEQYKKSEKRKVYEKERYQRPERREAMRRYSATPKAKATKALYRQASTRHRENMDRYRKSEKNKVYIRDYFQRPDVKERRKEYNKTPARKAAIRAYAISDRGIEVRLRYQKSAKGRENLTHAAEQRRTRKKGLPATFTLAQWRTCKEYWNHSCCICGREEGNGLVLAQEHWIPLSDNRIDNPGTVVENMLPMCHSRRRGAYGCNSLKLNRDPIEWVYLEFKDNADEIIQRIYEYFEWIKIQANPTD